MLFAQYGNLTSFFLNFVANFTFLLIALSICAATDPKAELAMEQLGKLRGCEVHSSVILAPVDEKIFKRLGVNITCQPRYKA